MTEHTHSEAPISLGHFNRNSDMLIHIETGLTVNPNFRAGNPEAAIKQFNAFVTYALANGFALNPDAMHRDFHGVPDAKPVSPPSSNEHIKIAIDAYQSTLDNNAKTKGQIAAYCQFIELKVANGKHLMVMDCTDGNAHIEIDAWDNSTGDDDKWKNPYHPSKGWDDATARQMWVNAKDNPGKYAIDAYVSVKKSGDKYFLQRVLKHGELKRS